MYCNVKLKKPSKIMEIILVKDTLYQCFYWSSGIILPSKENDLGHRELRTKEKLCLILKPKHSFIDGPKMAKTVGVS